MSLPEPAVHDTYEPTLWCVQCQAPMVLVRISEAPAWEALCPSCGIRVQVLP
jgi:hypothetical protein